MLSMNHRGFLQLQRGVASQGRPIDHRRPETVVLGLLHTKGARTYENPNVNEIKLQTLPAGIDLN